MYLSIHKSNVNAIVSLTDHLDLLTPITHFLWLRKTNSLTYHIAISPCDFHKLKYNQSHLWAIPRKCLHSLCTLTSSQMAIILGLCPLSLKTFPT